MNTIINTLIWNEPLSSALRFHDRVAEIVERFDVTFVLAGVPIAMVDGQTMHTPHDILSGSPSAEDAFVACGVGDCT
ncbi:MAG: hypothetical protein KBA71_09540 [Opitutaceae bacterium]|nr:hypothetical protein [Opitutaceae bacterium]